MSSIFAKAVAQAQNPRYPCPMPQDAFAHINHWIFDLDNTLYPPESGIFAQMNPLMAAYVMRTLDVDEQTAHKIRHDYWQTYGTTLGGLMHEHGIDPTPYLHEVHQIDLSNLPQNVALITALKALPGRKIVFTNGSRAHGHRVTHASGMDGIFDEIYGIEDTNYVPKPHKHAFATVFSLDDVVTKNAAMFEDDIRNLAVPHALGMNTVLVGPAARAEHVQYNTETLAEFLEKLV